MSSTFSTNSIDARQLTKHFAPFFQCELDRFGIRVIAIHSRIPNRYVEAVFTRDYPLVQGVVLITASSYVLINLLVDVSYTVLDPRIRVAGRSRER